MSQASLNAGTLTPEHVLKFIVMCIYDFFMCQAYLDTGTLTPEHILKFIVMLG